MVISNDSVGNEPTTAENQDLTEWQRLSVDPEVENYKPGQLDSVLIDPSDDSVAVVRFFLGAVPCEGAQPVIAETNDSVTISIEVGTHKNFAAMSCLAEQRGYEMTAQLSAPLGDRELLTP